MKAIVYYKYGSPDVLQLADIDKPVVNDNDILVKVHAASVNPYDWHFMRGTPYILRLMGAGLLKPKAARLGVDMAGVVEEVGSDITQFQAGDEVFGAGNGAFAEYVCTSEKALALKPANVTFEQAAAVPIAAITSLQGLRDKGQIRPGQKVLINGAAGGVGTIAVQIAKSFGAEVTGVCSTKSVDIVRSIGADQVVDYTREDFTQSGQRYDLIFDTVGNRSLSDYRRVLGPKGTLVMVGGASEGNWVGPLLSLFKTLVISRLVSQKLVPFMAKRSKDDLIVMRGLLESGKVTPVIDRTYTLSEVPNAIRYLEEGHARGKVVITIENKNKT
jgi:NADPH:quinone reductase-like Zn-dependent oxidoreductase